jgi:hypothetical protein
MFSYLAQSRAVYKIVYAHPPVYDFLKSDIEKLSLGFELQQTIWHKVIPSILERLMILHQSVHFGRDLMDEKKIQIVHDTISSVHYYFEVKYLTILLIIDWPD